MSWPPPTGASRCWRLLLQAPVAVALLALLLPIPASAAEGTASWFGEPYHGRRMANGQVYDMYDPTTAASREFALGTWLQVTAVASGRQVQVQVRDSGSFSNALDLSYAAFSALASPSAGTIRVRYDVIAGPGQAPRTASAPAAAPAPAARAPAPAPTAAPAAVQANSGRYTVESGDSLAAIARQFGVTMADLADWNDLSDPDLLRPGWALLVRPPSASVSAAASPPSATTSSPGSGQVYVVQDGDTLWGIASRLDVDPNALARANGLGPDDVIRVGQSLSVSTSQSLTVSNGQWYTVQTGDTLRAIADQYGTSVASLLQLNDLDDPDHLAIGQQLRVR